MSGIPGSRVGGIGPIGRYSVRRFEQRGPIKVLTERPEHAAARQRTPEEDAAVRAAVDRRCPVSRLDRLGRVASVAGYEIALHAHRRTCTDPTCFCDWSPA